jgi:hypothetical protein
MPWHHSVSSISGILVKPMFYQQLLQGEIPVPCFLRILPIFLHLYKIDRKFPQRSTFTRSFLTASWLSLMDGEPEVQPMWSSMLQM